MYIKKLLIRALTKSPGVSTSGLSFLYKAIAFSLIATSAHSADEHFHLFGYISTGELDGRHGHAFKTNSRAACVANKVNVIIMVLSTGTVVFA